jgi:hypothetical protein
MDEMKLLQEFRAAVTPPDDALLARARARMLDSGAAGQARGRARAPRLPGTWPRLALTGLAAATAAAAVAVALVVPGTGPARPAALTVKELAYRAAAAAAAQPAVAPGQWVYWHETTVRMEGTGQRGEPRQDIRLKPYRITYQVWTTADSGQAAYIVNGKIRYVCPSQTIQGPCQTIGQPSPFGLVDGRTVGEDLHTGRIPVSYAALSSLPTYPLALDRYFGSLRLPGQSAANREFQIIQDLLISYVMPPALTAELYRALGDVPGVTVNNHAVDAGGRTGLGFQIDIPTYPVNSHMVDQLILDPRTYEWMGYRDSWGGQPGQATAVLKSSLVSGPGVVP